MGIFRGVIFFILLAVGIGFAIQNDQPTPVKYYFGWVSPPLPLFLWVFLFLLLGLVLSGVAGYVFKIGLYARLRQQKKNLAELERKLERLKEEGQGK